jgi:AraC-like DNA-binding protein
MNGFEEKDMALTETHLPFSAFTNSSYEDVSYHWHNHMEILYLISGKAVVFVDNEAFEFSEGDFILINSNETHSTKSIEAPKFLVIQFKSSLINPNLDSYFEAKYFLPFIQKELKYTKHVKLNPDNTLKGLLLEILDDFEEKYTGYELNIKANIYKIFVWLIRNDYINLPPVNDMDMNTLSKISSVLEYISTNYMNEITVDSVSKMIFMSYHHFCRTFKKGTGRTFIEQLNFIRLREAEKLLITDEKNISEVALQVGFPTVTYFTRLFKKEKGITPLLYRKQHKSAKIKQN